MAEFPYELPVAYPDDDIAEYIPLLVTAVDTLLNNAYVWENPVDGQEKMEDLINWLTLNLPCVSMRELGEIILSGKSTPPSGFLACDGAAISRTTYAALFAVIGTTFGAGNGSTTFNLPDCRGRAPIGVGQGVGLSNRTLAGIMGTETHALVTAELASHNHRLDNSDGNDLFRHDGSGTGHMLTTTASSNSVSSRLVTESAGSGTAHNNMPPSLVLNFFIYTGV